MYIPKYYTILIFIVQTKELKQAAVWTETGTNIKISSKKYFKTNISYVDNLWDYVYFYPVQFS